MVTKNLLLKHKDKANVAVWSCQNRENTKKQVEALFGKTFTQLLFVSYCSNRPQLTGNPDPNDVTPIPMKRDLNIVYDKYSFHNEENTVVISNFK